MKRYIIAMTCFLIGIILLIGEAYCQEFDGFRGIKWGSSINDLTDMTPLTDDALDSKTYRRSNDKMKIGSADLKDILYTFYKGKFYSVLIKSEGFSNWIEFKNAVFAVYGEGRKINQFTDRWLWNTVNGNNDIFMTLHYKQILNESSLFILYKPIADIEKADKNLKAKESKKDF